jgi:hypothetical protein
MSTAVPGDRPWYGRAARTTSRPCAQHHLARYAPDHEVTRFVELATPEILATAGRVEEMLAA